MKQAVFHKVVPAPAKPQHLPENLHWLSGEGCGSWFHIGQSELYYIISRYNPEGKLECKGLFKQVSGNPVNLNNNFEFTYLSHCAVVNIIQYNVKITFNLIEKC